MREKAIKLDPRYTFDSKGNVVAELYRHPFTKRLGVWVPLDTDDRPSDKIGDIGRLVAPNREFLQERLKSRTRGY